MSFLKSIRELWDHLRGKGPAAAVALTIDLSTARDNQPINIEAGAVFVERCNGDLYARVNGPNGDGINLQYVKKILYPVSSLYLTNTAQAGKSARLLLLPTGMDADPPAAAAAAPGPANIAHGSAYSETTTTLVGGVWTTSLTLLFTATQACNLLIHTYVSFALPTAGMAIRWRISVDGVPGYAITLTQEVGGTREFFSQFHVAAVAAGAHTIILESYHSGTDGSSFQKALFCMELKTSA